MAGNRRLNSYNYSQAHCVVANFLNAGITPLLGNCPLLQVRGGGEREGERERERERGREGNFKTSGPSSG